MSRYSPSDKIFLVYRRGCRFVGTIKSLMTALDLGFIEVLHEDFDDDHPWRRYSSPTLMTVDGLDEEDIIVGGMVPEPDGVLESASPEWLEARFYGRCIDFAGLRDRLPLRLTGGLEASAWVLLSFREVQRAKIYFTRTKDPQFDGGEAAAIALDDAASIVFAGDFSETELGSMRSFALANREVLVKYWHWDIDTKECWVRLKPVATCAPE